MPNQLLELTTGAFRATFKKRRILCLLPTLRVYKCRFQIIWFYEDSMLQLSELITVASKAV